MISKQLPMASENFNFLSDVIVISYNNYFNSRKSNRVKWWKEATGQMKMLLSIWYFNLVQNWITSFGCKTYQKKRIFICWVLLANPQSLNDIILRLLSYVILFRISLSFWDFWHLRFVYYCRVDERWGRRDDQRNFYGTLAICHIKIHTNWKIYFTGGEVLNFWATVAVIPSI